MVDVRMLIFMMKRVLLQRIHTIRYRLKNCINSWNIGKLVFSVIIYKVLSPTKILNCWNSVKLNKPQHNDEINIGVTVAKAEKIIEIFYD